jgi:hypothetical protein
MQADRTPIILILVILVFDIVFGFVTVREVYFSRSNVQSRVSEVLSSATSSVPRKESKDAAKPPSSASAAVDLDSESLSAKTAGDPVKPLPMGVVSPAPDRKLTQQGQTADVNVDRVIPVKQGPVKSLRSNDGRLPTGDLRSGADAQPMGSLRSPGESNFTGSLRADDHVLPSGSLRPDDQNFPTATGSLR